MAKRRFGGAGLSCYVMFAEAFCHGAVLALDACSGPASGNAADNNQPTGIACGD
jgi:hypothetical protein